MRAVDFRAEAVLVALFLTTLRVPALAALLADAREVAAFVLDPAAAVLGALAAGVALGAFLGFLATFLEVDLLLPLRDLVGICSPCGSRYENSSGHALRPE